MSILKDIDELLGAGVISDDVAKNIKNYYKGKPSNSASRVMTVFAVIGAALIGLGLTLIFAHNWDQIPRSVKTIIAVIPLLIGQAACFYTLYKNKGAAWVEASSTFVFFAFASSMALTAQIYNIPSSGGTFLLVWSLLMLPVMYIMRSSMVCILYLLTSTYYLVDAHNSLTYMLLIIAMLPCYYLLYKNEPKSNYISFMNWILPISLLCGLSLSINDGRINEYAATLGFALVFCYQLGNSKVFTSHGKAGNGFKIIGLMGTAAILILISFPWGWEFLNESWSKIPTIAIILAIGSVALFLFQNVKVRKIEELTPIGLISIPFMLILMFKVNPAIGVIASNLIAISLAFFYIYKGLKLMSLAMLNYGLLLISIIICCRFFDSEMSFAIRGLVFIAMGIALFMVNLHIIKKRRSNE